MSLMVAVRVTLAVLLIGVWKLTLAPAMKALMSLSEPVSVSALAVPPTVTPLPEVADSEPLGTERVTVTLPLPASASAKLMPVMAEATSSTTVMPPGRVATGASLVRVTVRVRLAAALLAAPSLTMKLMVRLVVTGSSELLL
ncbi:hypothetical protein D9M69_554280 [compost metagenome]